MTGTLLPLHSPKGSSVMGENSFSRDFQREGRQAPGILESLWKRCASLQPSKEGALCIYRRLYLQESTRIPPLWGGFCPWVHPLEGHV